MIYRVDSEPINKYQLSHVCSLKKKGDSLLHFHQDAYEIMLFKKGNVDYIINGTTFHLQPGNITFIRPNDIHGYIYQNDSVYERLNFHITGDFAKSLSSPHTDLLECFHFPSSVRYLEKEQAKEFELYLDNAIEYLNEKKFGYDIRFFAYMSLILLLFNESKSVPDFSYTDIFPKIIQDTLTYINEHFTEDISVQSIADYINVSRSHLSHLFKNCMGISLWNYVLTKRIQLAKTLLKSGSSITDTCYECGFSDYANFIKTFSKLSGTSPGKYAKIKDPEQLYDTNTKTLYF